ncbi:helix-turn-helix domain-containing protein [Novosphingobium sp. FSY-8]|uniref:Helix-turn-helix domain-containing protein n=1 Tax=Novosphingobium ovatum TaxID=1908523 RepID=A0ABW9XFM0_9SPHN|nr:helix-turn-helix domain-containing protein [Novosphingobium ovatum]
MDFFKPPVYAGRMAGELKDKIRKIRLSLGLKQDEFGQRLQTNQSTVSRWERGALPDGVMLHRIAELANTTVEMLIGTDDIAVRPADSIPVVGFVGAGSAIYPYDDYPRGDGMDFVERPPFVTGQAVAVEVRGDSLFPVAEDGWRLVYAGQQAVVEEEILNRLCVVQLADGRMLVKRVIRGTAPQRYHLASTNAPLIEDVEITWAARVKAIIPD